MQLYVRKYVPLKESQSKGRNVPMNNKFLFYLLQKTVTFTFEEKNGATNFFFNLAQCNYLYPLLLVAHMSTLNND